jgi:rubrerythrin
MAKTTNLDKKRLISEFEMAQSLELSAAELYTKIASAPDIEDQSIKTTFKTLAKDEQRHAKIVQEIIELIQNCL